jgi:hypothetical protein
MELGKRLSHDAYGKRVLMRVPNAPMILSGPELEVRYGTPHPARIDAVSGEIAIELESRTAKQIRGAVVDLISHPYPKKLLIILPVHMSDAEVAAAQCRHLFKRYAPQSPSRVVVLRGSAGDPQEAADAAIIEKALRELADEG